MGNAAENILSASRPPGATGRGDKYLGEIAQELRRVLWKTQKGFISASCRLPDVAWSDISALLVEWAEDVHNDIGLWRTVETHQRQCLGTSLPLIVNSSGNALRTNLFPLRRRVGGGLNFRERADGGKLAHASRNRQS